MNSRRVFSTALFLLVVIVFSTLSAAYAQEPDPPPPEQAITIYVDPPPGEEWEPFEKQLIVDVKSIEAIESAAVDEEVVRRAAAGMVDYVEIDTLILIYSDTAMGYVEPRYIERLKEQVRESAEFYWRHSHLKLHLNLTFVEIDAYKDETEFENLWSDCRWLMPYDGDGDGASVENDLLALGFGENQFDSINLFFGGENGTLPPCAGGLAFGPWTWDHLGYTQFTGNLVGIGWDVWQPFAHEFQHSIDSMFHLAGKPEYFHADRPQDTSGRFGHGPDFHMTKMREWPVADWFELLKVWGDLHEVADTDMDGVPDNAPALYITEETLGSDPGNPDSDADGLDDLQEAMAAMWQSSNVTKKDTDKDGRIDGSDSYPIYALEPDIPYKSLQLDGQVDNWSVLMDQVTETTTPFEASFSANWDDDFLYLMFRTDRFGRIQMWLDVAGNGFFHDYGYEIILNPSHSNPLELVHVQDCSRGYLDAYDGICRYDDAGSYPWDQLVTEDDLQAFATQDGSGYLVQLAIPRNDALGLDLQKDHEIGLSVLFHGIEHNWRKRAWLFEEEDLVYLELTQDPVPEVYVSANRASKVAGINYARGDILHQDADGTWSMVFDAIGAGIPKRKDLHAFTFLEDGSMLMVFDKSIKLPGTGKITPRDIVRFEPASGTFEPYLTGSDIGLNSSGEKIDALHYAGGKLYISVSGRFTVVQDGNKIIAQNEDVLEYADGIWTLFWDGSIVDPHLKRKNMQSLWLDSSGQPYFSLSSSFKCSGERVNPKDVISYESGVCRKVWNGADNGFKSSVDALHMGAVELPPQPDKSSITICVEADPADDTTFSYGGSLGSFSLSDPSNRCRQFTNLDPGEYQVGESAIPSWHNQDISCQVTTGSSDWLWYYVGALHIDLGAASSIECTYTNYYEVIGEELYISANAELTVGGIAAARGDILHVDKNENWELFFDASDYGIATLTDLHAFSIREDGTILMVFDRGVSLPGLSGTATPWDIVLFMPTTGTFDWYLDGSDVGLSASGEKIDGLDETLEGTILLSVFGRFAVAQDGGKVTGDNEDILGFTPSQLGADTQGVWALWWDPSTVIDGIAGENIAGFSIHYPYDYDDYMFSFNNAYKFGDVTGDQKDILNYSNLGAYGDFLRVPWRGPEHGFKKAIDGIHVYWE